MSWQDKRVNARVVNEQKLHDSKHLPFTRYWTQNILGLSTLLVADYVSAIQVLNACERQKLIIHWELTTCFAGDRGSAFLSSSRKTDGSVPFNTCSLQIAAVVSITESKHQQDMIALKGAKSTLW